MRRRTNSVELLSLSAAALLGVLGGSGNRELQAQGHRVAVPSIRS